MIRKSKIVINITILLAGLFLLLGGLANNTIYANHSRTNFQCQEVYGLSGPQFDLCVEHADVDTARQQCVNNFSDDETARNTCINGISRASDGYGPNGYPPTNFGSGGTPGSNSCSDELDDGTCYGQDFEFFRDQNKINPIYWRLNQIIAFLSVGVGVAVTISVIVASIQWSTSGGEPQKRAAAVKRLWNNGIALGVFVLGWLLLNWLIPGGPLN